MHVRSYDLFMDLLIILKRGTITARTAGRSELTRVGFRDGA